MSLPATFKRAAFLGKGEPLTIQEVPMIYPGKDEVLVKVEACGVCYSDVYAQMNAMGAGFPIVPGHEIIGHIVALGEGVTAWKIGNRVGSGWHGFHDGTCHTCKAGYYQMCDSRQVNGVSRNGGYAEYTLLSTTSLSSIPSHLPAASYAPILCAGLTVFNTLLHQPNLTPGSTVAIHGLGGLGHLAIQYANKCGYRVVALSRGKGKEELARKLGAHEYVDTKERDASEALRELGFAKVVVTTSPDGEEMKGLLGGLGPEGRLVVLSVPRGGKVDVDVGALMKYGLSISSWPSGHAKDAEEAVKFTELAGVECMVEEFSLEKANDAFDAMLNGSVRFRSVISFD